MNTFNALDESKVGVRQHLLRIVIAAVSYSSAGWFGLKPWYVSYSVTLIWSPTGIAVAADPIGWQFAAGDDDQPHAWAGVAEVLGDGEAVLVSR